MKTIELNVAYFKSKGQTAVLRYEWFGLKNQAKRIRWYVEVE